VHHGFATSSVGYQVDVVQDALMQHPGEPPPERLSTRDGAGPPGSLAQLEIDVDASNRPWF
jgi:hypothetical protein